MIHINRQIEDYNSNNDEIARLNSIDSDQIARLNSTDSDQIARLNSAGSDQIARLNSQDDTVAKLNSEKFEDIKDA